MPQSRHGFTGTPRFLFRSGRGSVKLEEREKDFEMTEDINESGIAGVPDNVMTSISSLLNKFNEVIPSASCDFDLLSSAIGSVNENSHTRVLGSLLKVDFICESFFRFLDRHYPGRGIEKVLSGGISNVEVTCLKKWMDIFITVGDFKIIIENKVRGACDQDGQIDRYVSAVKKHGVKKEKVFVFYLTSTGGEPDQKSLCETDEILGRDNARGGRLIAINYLKDVLSWLNEIIATNIELNFPEYRREPFRSYLLQYRHHIEGPALLGLREEKDGYSSFRSEIDKLSNSVLGDVCVWGYFDWLYRRQLMCRSITETKDVYEHKQFFKTLFYKAFDRVVSEDGFYDVVSIKDGRLYASLPDEAGFGNSLVQINVWSNEAENLSLVMKNCVDFEILKDCFESNLSMSGNPMVRFHIERLEHFIAVMNVLGVGLIKPDGEIQDVFAGYKNYRKMIEIIKECARRRYDNSVSHQEDPLYFEMWNCVSNDVNHNYWYINNWAIQLYEDPHSLIRAIDVFGSRNVMDEEVASFQEYVCNQKEICPYQCLAWNGRVFFRFPTPTKQYAECLVSLLKKWRENFA